MKRIDHIVIRVDNLHEGVAEFEAAGFRVFYARKSQRGNALIYLQDNSMLELVGTTPQWARPLIRLRIPSLMHPFLHRIGQYAFKESCLLDYPIYSPDIKAMYERVQDSSTKLLSAKREKPNGTVVGFTLFGPKDLNLPFVMSAYTPEKMSDDETNIHPNGINNLHAVDVTYVGDTETFKEQLVAYYQIDRHLIHTHENSISIQTENARINYAQSDQHKITAISLKPRNVIVDAKLKQYGLSTTDDL